MVDPIFQVTFWGVRGSLPCAGPRFLRYGGNTSCVAMQCGTRHLVFDAGTGIRGLGQDLLQRGVTQAELFFSHVHWDHIMGFPFFEPAYHPGFSLKIHCGNLSPESSIRDVLAMQMSAPAFPVGPEALGASIAYHDFLAGEALLLDSSIRIRTLPLNHPNRATAYRVIYENRSVCYVTDTEHRKGELDASLLEFIKNSDMLIYDSTYSDEQFDRYIGWGHSTWQQGIRLAQAAGVGRLAIFHHDPDSDDARMDQIASAALATWTGAFVAREGLVITL